MAEGRLHVPYLSQCYDALVGATFNLIWFCRVCTYFDIEKVGPVEVKLMGVAMDTEPYPVVAGLLIRKAVTW